MQIYGILCFLPNFYVTFWGTYCNNVENSYCENSFNLEWFMLHSLYS